MVTPFFACPLGFRLMKVHLRLISGQHGLRKASPSGSDEGKVLHMHQSVVVTVLGSILALAPILLKLYGNNLYHNLFSNLQRFYVG